jgi:hypothetical protein
MKTTNKTLISDADVTEERERQLAGESLPHKEGTSIYDDLPFAGFTLTDEMLETLRQRFDLHN